MLAHPEVVSCYKFIGFLIMLGFVYIGSGYIYQFNDLKERMLTKEIEDLKYQYLAVKSELTEMKRGSVVEDSVKTEKSDLSIPKTASYIIK